MDDGWLKDSKDANWFEAILISITKVLILIFFIVVIIELIWG